MGKEGMEMAFSEDAVSGNMIYQPILKNGVFRLDCSAEDRLAASPSLSFKKSKQRDTPIMGHEVPFYTPIFECLMGQQIVKLELPAGTSFYGIGVVSGQLERSGKRFLHGTPMHGVMVLEYILVSVTPMGASGSSKWGLIGVLHDTTRRCEIDLRNESKIQFIAPSPYPVITFGAFDAPAAVLKCLSIAIGTICMPPKWSLGYHQCSWSYDSEKRVREIARIFRRRIFLVMSCGWISITWMVSIVSLWTRSAFQIQNLWLEICTKMALKQSGCLTPVSKPAPETPSVTTRPEE